ncbi:MAG: hypothetical protein F6J99_02590 [Moorea sp. SIO4G3]|nr:hypothetical protein [Moorena sp. SIO4G3]
MIKAQLSYGNYRLWRRLAVGHAKGEREQTMSDCRGFPHSLLHQDIIAISNFVGYLGYVEYVGVVVEKGAIKLLHCRNINS